MVNDTPPAGLFDAVLEVVEKKMFDLTFHGFSCDAWTVEMESRDAAKESIEMAVLSQKEKVKAVCSTFPSFF